MNKLILAAALATLVGFSLYNMSVNAPTDLNDDAEKQMFNQWCMQNGKAYGNDDEKVYRFNNFKANVDEIKANESKDYELALNQFADLNSGEFLVQYTGLADIDTESEQENVDENLESLDAPGDWDWVAKGKVSPVQNQGSCGSCWAFSATASLENFKAIATGSLPKFSEQAMVDCAGSYGNHGCNGGWMPNAFRWSGDVGTALAKQYPYTGRVGTCKIGNVSKVFVNKGYSNVRRDSNLALVNAIWKGVVAVAINATGIQFYRKGVFSKWSINPNGLNHGVNAVGYGVDRATGKKFYKIRNSWGSRWGEGGYIRFERRDSGVGLAGVTRACSYPTGPF